MHTKQKEKNVYNYINIYESTTVVLIISGANNGIRGEAVSIFLKFLIWSVIPHWVQFD